MKNWYLVEPWWRWQGCWSYEKTKEKMKKGDIAICYTNRHEKDSYNSEEYLPGYWVLEIGTDVGGAVGPIDTLEKAQAFAFIAFPKKE